MLFGNLFFLFPDKYKVKKIAIMYNMKIQKYVIVQMRVYGISTITTEYFQMNTILATNALVRLQNVIMRRLKSNTSVALESIP